MKNKYVLKIELLSDMCVSDGGVYNSALDMEVCHDKYGFPYIPAKRLKGCLREAALELRDWGLNINVEEIFGKKDHGQDNYNNRAALRLEDAYVENYGELKDFVSQNRNAKILHHQNVLGNYSYIRTQTSIDYDTGVADAGSLRTMRVVKKGLAFYAELILEEKYKDDFIKCCTNMNHMGISRTRGLGEVKLTLEDKVEDVHITSNNKKVTLVSEGDNCFEYSITLKEPVICKSVNGGESNTLDYIEGSKILGLLVGKLKEQNMDFIDFVNRGELFCSNAYIDIDGRRGTEVPGSVFFIKNEGNKFIDKIVHEEPEKKQLNSMKHCYIAYDEEGSLNRKNVNTEEHYHHSRPEDKSIGRANDSLEGSKMYQMSSICQGQSFRGYITGSEEQIVDIAKLFKENDEAYIGYSRSAEYGKTVFDECGCSKKEDIELKECKEIAIKLDAPTIIYNDNATYSTNPEDLIAEINAWLGIECNNIHKYIKYTTIGGYNVTWRKRKPTIEAFDKGTVLHYVFNEPIDIKVPAMFYVGERVTEGYGECSVSKIVKSSSNTVGIALLCDEENDNEKIDYEKSNDLVVNICDKLYKEYVSKKINEISKKMPISEADLSTISNMFIMCKENNSFNTIIDVAKERYNKASDTKKYKKGIAEEIIGKVENNIITEDVKDEFEANYGICHYSIKDNDMVKSWALEELLIALKYKVRTMKVSKGGEKHE